VLTTDGNGKANGRNGCKPEGRDGNGNETGGRKDGNGKAIEAERKGREGLPSFSFLPFPLSFLPSFSHIRTHERKQNFVSACPLFFAVHPDFLSIRRK
jgi:hypothetical protein